MRKNMETASKDPMKSMLEFELSLDWSDLRSHAWYHGNLSRSAAENLLRSSGDFLVRDCSSKPGDYVLSANWQNIKLHFVIQKILTHQDTIYEKLQYTFEDEAFETVADLVTFYVGNRKIVSQASGAILSKPVNRSIPLCFQSSHRQLKESMTLKYSRSLNRQNSLCQSSTRLYRGPQKPNRSNSFHGANRDLVSRSSSSLSMCQKCDEITSSSSIHSSENMSFPNANSPSVITAETFTTNLLPKENRPLDHKATLHLCDILLNVGPRILAAHITRVDLEFIRHTRKSANFGLGINSGLELLFLPHGHQYRDDFIDKTKCFTYLIVLSIIQGTSERERAAIVDKWIRIAVECKTAFGNLTAFSSIVAALSKPQIIRLDHTWLVLRQSHTADAVMFESKLRPNLKALVECTEPQAPNTTFPFVLTAVEILQKHDNFMENFNEEATDNEMIEFFEDFHFDFPFERTTVDFGLEVASCHLENCRSTRDRIDFYRQNAEIVLDGITFEPITLDLFRPEFHRRYFWGFRGCNAAAVERYEKFDRALQLLSEEAEKH